MLPSEEELRAALIARAGAEIQEKLSGATVALCGLGGLGSNIALALARAGVGTLVLIDYDKVDITNLNRQQYKASQLGISKTKALTENLRELAPYINIISHNVKITEENAAELLCSADIVCEAFDNADAKAMIAEAVLCNMPDKVLVAASGMAGLGSPNEITTRKISEKFYLCGDGKSDVEELGSLFAPRVMLCAAHQALTVLRILTGKTDL